MQLKREQLQRIYPPFRALSTKVSGHSMDNAINSRMDSVFLFSLERVFDSERVDNLDLFQMSTLFVENLLITRLIAFS
jgi:hypothetical protein